MRVSYRGGSKPLATLSPLWQVVDFRQYNHRKVGQFYVFKEKKNNSIAMSSQYFVC